MVQHNAYATQKMSWYIRFTRCETCTKAMHSAGNIGHRQAGMVKDKPRKCELRSVRALTSYACMALPHVLLTRNTFFVHMSINYHVDLCDELCLSSRPAVRPSILYGKTLLLDITQTFQPVFVVVLLFLLYLPCL